MIDKLTEAMTVLPGVGQKTAQRYVYYLLEREREAGKTLAKILYQTLDKVKNCAECQTISIQDLCYICGNKNRDNSLLCVTETPTDVDAIEKAGAYKGKYFVLSGYLSPIDRVSAEDLKLDQLNSRLQKGVVKELILATNATVEGELTAHYIYSMAAAFSIPVSRIARGIPLGGELEYTDPQTIAHALGRREKYSNDD